MSLMVEQAEHEPILCMRKRFLGEHVVCAFVAA